MDRPSAMGRVLVSGGRDFTDRLLVWDALDFARRRVESDGMMILVHGDCPTGADHFADLWAIDRRVPVERHRVNEETWDQDGKRAGPERNQRMVNLGARVVITFAGNKGTADLTNRALSKGLKVLKARRTTATGWTIEEVERG